MTVLRRHFGHSHYPRELLEAVGLLRQWSRPEIGGARYLSWARASKVLLRST